MKYLLIIFVSLIIIVNATQPFNASPAWSSLQKTELVKNEIYDGIIYAGKRNVYRIPVNKTNNLISTTAIVTQGSLATTTKIYNCIYMHDFNSGQFDPFDVETLVSPKCTSDITKTQLTLTQNYPTNLYDLYVSVQATASTLSDYFTCVGTVDCYANYTLSVTWSECEPGKLGEQCDIADTTTMNNTLTTVSITNDLEFFVYHINNDNGNEIKIDIDYNNAVNNNSESICISTRFGNSVNLPPNLTPTTGTTQCFIPPKSFTFEQPGHGPFYYVLFPNPSLDNLQFPIQVNTTAALLDCPTCTVTGTELKFGIPQSTTINDAADLVYSIAIPDYSYSVKLSSSISNINEIAANTSCTLKANLGTLQGVPEAVQTLKSYTLLSSIDPETVLVLFDPIPGDWTLTISCNSADNLAITVSAALEQCPNNCNGNGNCNTATGVCECFAGFDGPSCNEIITLTVASGPVVKEIHFLDWLYIVINPTVDTTYTIKLQYTGITLPLYEGDGKVPTRMDYLAYSLHTNTILHATSNDTHYFGLYNANDGVVGRPQENITVTVQLTTTTNGGTPISETPSPNPSPDVVPPPKPNKSVKWFIWLAVIFSIGFIVISFIMGGFWMKKLYSSMKDDDDNSNGAKADKSYYEDVDDDDTTISALL